MCCEPKSGGRRCRRNTGHQYFSAALGGCRSWMNRFTVKVRNYQGLAEFARAVIVWRNLFIRALFPDKLKVVSSVPN
jgi:hypothetical protein